MEHIIDLRRAFDIADLDGNNQIGRLELETVLAVLQPTAAGHDKAVESFERLWACMNPPSAKSATVGWVDFLCSVPRIRREEGLISLITAVADEAGVARQNWELLTLLIDTRINKAEEHRLREGMGAPQKLGIQILKKLRKPMALETMQDVLRRAREGKLHIFSEEQGARNSRPCAQQYVGKYQSCMVISGRLIVGSPQRLDSLGRRQVRLRFTPPLPIHSKHANRAARDGERRGGRGGQARRLAAASYCY